MKPEDGQAVPLPDSVSSPRWGEDRRGGEVDPSEFCLLYSVFLLLLFPFN